MPPPAPLEEAFPPDRRERIRTELLAWFQREQRDLPWRRDPSPYAVWVSEMMLQQTQVATVIPYYERWMARFPTLESLAAADEQEVLHAWQGLGYYSRARNLLRGAREVVERLAGVLPRDPAALRALPGIGPYTAGAIASIAYNVPAPIVDGNVIRVLTRLGALRGDPQRAPLKQQLWRLAELLVPRESARDFNPALMELGATVCVPVNPRCGRCPVAAECDARRLGVAAELPETAPRPEPTPVRMAAAVVRRENRLLLVQLPPDAPRWAGMWQFPNVELEPDERPEAGAERAARLRAGVAAVPKQRLAVIRHGVTRFRITLEAWECEAAEGSPEPGELAAWIAPEQLGDYPLPAAHRRIADRVSKGADQLELFTAG
ncbi:MAG: A/G-specific adenine glycosylase [Armatimonadota bacterium]